MIMSVMLNMLQKTGRAPTIGAQAWSYRRVLRGSGFFSAR